NSSASSNVSTTAAQLTATNGPRRRRPKIVQLASHEFFARAALAFDQYGEMGGCDALNLCSQCLHDLCRADQGTGAQRRGRGACSPPSNFKHEAPDMRQCYEHIVVSAFDGLVGLA